MNEAELIFTEILNCNRTDLYLNRKRVLTGNESALVSSILKRRIKGEPVQYILGRTEFMGREFNLTADVFIPRPETEILVEAVWEFAGALNQGRHLDIIDIGTGSGCIAVSLARLLPSVTMTAVDISDKALMLAERNAVLNNCRDKIIFFKSNLFYSLKLKGKKFDAVVSNPPYIRSSEIKGLEIELSYEPCIALDGGIDGLDFYRYIINDAPNYLLGSGFLVMEMGFGQCEDIQELVNLTGQFDIIKIINDYNDISRVMVLRLK